MPTIPMPYRSTPVFDADTLPAALQREHRTKRGVWGVVRVLAGRLRLTFVDPPGEVELTVGRPGLLLPEQPHFVTVDGPLQVRIDFYDEPPTLDATGCDQEDKPS